MMGRISVWRKKVLAKKGMIIFHLIVISLISLVYFKQSDEITNFKVKLYYMRYKYLDNRIDCTDYPPIMPSKGAWYEDARLIYHAGGGIDGLAYTNSREALEETLQKGIRFVEVDFMYTSEQELVCLHDWEYEWNAEEKLWNSEDVLSLQDFTSQKIYGKYTTMTAAEVVEYMDKYPDLYIIIDTKEEDVIKVMKTLIDLSAYNTDITDRFVIQLYEDGVKSEIQKLYPFKDSNYLFTIYKYGSNKPNIIMKICYDENISVVTLPHGAWSDEIIQQFLSKGFILYEHTVNRPDYANESLEKGVWGFYTDFLSYDDLHNID